MNFTELKIAMVRKSLSIPALSAKMGVSKKLMYSRMKGETPFTQKEIMQMADILDLNQEEIIKIFFGEKVS